MKLFKQFLSKYHYDWWETDETRDAPGDWYYVSAPNVKRPTVAPTEREVECRKCGEVAWFRTGANS